MSAEGTHLSESDLLLRVERLLDEALRALQRESSGAPLCQLQKEGRVTGGLKYEEGRAAAFSDLRRRLRAAPAKDRPLLVVDAATAVVAELAALQAAGRPLPWIAYAQGQVDALAALSDGESSR